MELALCFSLDIREANHKCLTVYSLLSQKLDRLACFTSSAIIKHDIVKCWSFFASPSANGQQFQ